MPRRGRLPRRHPLLVTVTLGALAVTACGGGGDAAVDTTATTADAPAPVSTRAPAADPTATTPATPPPATDPDDTGPDATDPDDPAGTDPPAATDAASSTIAPGTTTAPATTTTVAPDPPPPNEQLTALRFDLEIVAPIAKPTAVAWRDGDPAMYVSTQPGPIVRVLDGEVATVIDLTAETFEDLPGSERGILGIAFDPRDGRMFVNYTDLDHDTRVVSFELVDGVAVPESRREVLFIDQPGVGHNGGRLLFDDAGNLYVGSGDGGASNGRDAQDTTKLLGAILRIVPNLDGDGYSIPADNPFADGVADRPEIWARGFRNPWTFSLDDETGDLWIGDVGNNEFEEISVMRGGEAGQNFGWYWYEGNNRRHSGAPDDVVPPVYDYPHSQGVAVMAGHVYRGAAIPELRGAFVFGDLTGPIWAIGAAGVSRLDAPPVNTMTGWAEGPDGELYVLSLRDGVAKLIV